MKTASSTERWILADQREFLLRSLDDAAAEHAAGDLDDADFALLDRRDRAKLAEVEAQLAAVDAADAAAADAADAVAADAVATSVDGAAVDAAGVDGAGAEAVGSRSTRPVSSTRSTRSTRSTSRTRSAGGARSTRDARSRTVRQRRDDLGQPKKQGWRPRRRTWMGVVGAIALVAGALVLVFGNTSSRLPGEVATGGVNLSGKKLVEQELDQAAVLDDEGKVVTAMAVYNKVLVKHPRQSTALAEDGWLLWQSGVGAKDAALEARGRAKVVEAVKVAPTFFAGHLFLGTIDVQQDADAGAVVQYRLFLADHPPSSWTRNFASAIRQAFTGAAQPVPAGVPDN